MKRLQNQLRQTLLDLLKGSYDISSEDIQFSIPADRKFGDLSTPLPFTLAKRVSQKPFLVGQNIISEIEKQVDIFSKISLAGGGFINFYFHRSFLFNYLLEHFDRQPQKRSGRFIVEHTSINPNKSAHIGHLRNSCLGDTLARSLRFLGYDVEIQNYIDDTGIQIADVVWGLLYLEKKTLDEIQAIPDLASYLWELYSRVYLLFSEDETLEKQRNEVHRKIEDKVEPEYSISQSIAHEVLRDHIRVMGRLDIVYDLLVNESDIIELEFFDWVAQSLREKGIMYQSQDPAKKGCWVIRYDRENIEKIIIRSNGTVTYIGKDIAYTYWKLGLVKKDFYYREFHRYENGHPVDMTTAEANSRHVDYGRGVKVFNVIDVRQSYLQNLISQIVDRVATDNGKGGFSHFSYEMVALTPRCVKEMGLPVSGEELKKAYVEVSGRRGIAVKADDLIDQLIQKSLQEVRSRDPEIAGDQAALIANDIAIAALRYFMIKYNSRTVIAFDFKEALSFEGDTGPYLQYTLVRLNSILKKVPALGSKPEQTNVDVSPLPEKEYAVFHEILLQILNFENQVEFAIDSEELSGIAAYAYSLCQKINHYYHLFPILSEKDEQLKRIRLNFILLVKNKLVKLLDLLGIPVPAKM